MSQNTQANVKKRRKKASRACSHCQKAHLTCDDARPCQRCIKRGLETTCTDGIRKKAKYLQDDESDSASYIMTPPAPILNYTSHGFVSDTANLEYDMLSNMIPNYTSSNNNTPIISDTNSINPYDNWLIQPSPQSTLVMDNSYTTGKRRKGVGNTPEEIYSRVTKPYNYVDSYHYLLNYVKQRMGREELVRISRALVLFRPSYMSVVATLTEEDLIYMEKCVQRTLLEFEKLISFSGTPTVVWRRTGEIVLVGKEFLLLTQWSKEALIGQKKYIYELMDNGSAIEYWEKFSQHAFDNAESGVYMSVILMSPSFRAVPCSFCFTLKRDIFDLPCVVVGNFLPILGVNTG